MYALVAIILKLFKTIRLIWIFYKSFLVLSLFINLCCISIFWNHGFSSFSVIFWLKMATLALTYYFINTYKNKEYYYYLNLGISKFLLWIVSLSFDFVLFISLIILTNTFR